jgi:phosphatidylserine/phosphatidylglycerophosphate/cardiolipin synthase-like enzyme
MARQSPIALNNRPTIKDPAPDREWWAHGDTDVQIADVLTPLVDGRAAMLAMCVAFLTAKESIWLAEWSLHAKLRMVRGHDQRAGKDGSPEQTALIERLRAAGLDDDAIALWEADKLSVLDVLGFAARRGVQVRVLLWGPYNPGGLLHLVGDPDYQQKLLRAEGVDCRLDKSNRSPFHLAQALHQKCATVDGRIAFVGGIDLAVQHSGDFDRWDTPSHPFESKIRSTDLGVSPHPWHDVHLLLTGAPAADIEHNIRQRWEESDLSWWRKLTPPLKHLARTYTDEHRQMVAEQSKKQEANELRGVGPDLPGAAARVQVVRTIPAITYRFAPKGINTIAESYIRALHQARNYIYIETQYLWREGLSSFIIPGLGIESRYMRGLFDGLVEAARRGVTIAMVLPDHPNIGRGVTDRSIERLLREAPEAAAEGRLRFFCLASSEGRSQDNLMRYRPVYVHAKVSMVDDCWATIGSANLNSRGMSHDAELNLAVLDSEVSRGLRIALWAEHLGALRHAHAGWPGPACIPLSKPLETPESEGVLSLIQEIDSWLHHPEQASGATLVASNPIQMQELEDPIAGIDLLTRHANQNLERLRRGEVLEGQLLPYLRYTESKARNLKISRAKGFLDPMRGVREGVKTRHPRRYT